MLLSIIIVSYNTKDLLKQCLDSIIKSLTDYPLIDNKHQTSSKRVTARDQASSFSYEIIVVDNNSQDGSFAKANNQGIKIAKGEYILFLNPDTIVLPKTISTAVHFIKSHPNVGVATCRVELKDGSLDDGCHRGFPTPWNAFCHFSGLEKIFPKSKLFAGYSLGHLLSESKPHEIDACVGAFMLVPRFLGEKIGWWDEDFFWYGEDLDFCYRAKKAGYQIFYLPQVKILHYKGASSGIKKTKSKAKKETRLKAMLASTQAMRIFYNKHFRGHYPWLIEKLVFLGINLLEKYRLFRVKVKYGKGK